MANSTKFLPLTITTGQMPLLAKLKSTSTAFQDSSAEQARAGLSANQAGVYYAENVLPTSKGLKATKPVVFANGLLNGDVTAKVDYTDAIDVAVFNLIDSNNSKAILVIKSYWDSVTSEYKVAMYTYNPDAHVFAFQVDSSGFVALAGLTSSVVGTKYHFTCCDIEGVSIVSINMRYLDSGTRRSKTIVFKVVNNSVAPTVFEDITSSLVLKFDNTVATGTPTDSWLDVTKGFESSNNYLIGYSENSVAWTSPLDPFNFTPSLATGAGAGKPSGIHGLITELVASPSGFNVWMTAGIITARLNTNSSYPWVFKPISSTAGVDHANQVSKGATQFAVTSSGLLSVVNAQVSQVATEFTDFITAGYIESYSGGLLTHTKTPHPLEVLVRHVSDRYLTISFKLREAKYFSYCLVYDTVLKSFGKIKTDHMAVFPISLDVLGKFITYSDLEVAPNDLTYEQLQQISYSMVRSSGTDNAASVGYTLGMVGLDGSLSVVSPSITVGNAGGVVLLGKLSIKKGVMTMLDKIVVEEISTDQYFKVSVTTDYGSVIAPVVTTLTEIKRSEGVREYNSLLTGVYHTVNLEGSFNLTDVTVALRGAGYS